jgi:hypothetical protein
VIVRFQLAMLPASTQQSSKTYRLQVPFGLVPSKVESATLPLGVGAGAGNGSPSPSSQFVGW